MNKKTLHCIYVSDPSRDNFLTGLNQGVWGLKKLNSHSEEFRKGDYLLFAHKILGKVRSKFQGPLNQYVLVKITSDVYQISPIQNDENPKIWADEKNVNCYLNRFKFTVLNSYPTLKQKDNKYILNEGFFNAGEDIASIKVYEALRYSSCVQGTNGCISNCELLIKEENIQDKDLKNLSNIFNLKDAVLKRNPDSATYFDDHKPNKQVNLAEESLDSDLDDDLDRINQKENLTPTEKSQMVLSRIGQGKFRKDLLKKYKKCLLTGIAHTALLVASHIKPWRDCDDKERLDSKNGLLLSSLMDRLFDRYFITFDENLKLLVCDDPLIFQIVVEHQLVDFVLKEPYKGENLTIFKQYMACHRQKFKEINEKRYGEQAQES